MNGELRTTIMEKLREMEDESKIFQETLRREMAALESRLNESERNLARLSEFYKTLTPLIAAIEQEIKSGAVTPVAPSKPGRGR